MKGVVNGHHRYCIWEWEERGKRRDTIAKEGTTIRRGSSGMSKLNVCIALAEISVIAFGVDKLR